jgi:hypothetical protein
MSEQAIAFVEEWVLENVMPVPDDSRDSLAAALAVQCAADAKDAGITDAELKDAFENLTAFMSAAIVTAVDVSRDRSKDN